MNQGICAEIIASRWKFSRAELDEYSARSHERAARTQAGGGFDHEIVPIEVTGPDGMVTVHLRDQTVRTGTTPEPLGGLASAFHDARSPELKRVITPGNSSPLTYGATAAPIMSTERAAVLGLCSRAGLHTLSVIGSDPLLMLAGVIPTTQKALARSGLSSRTLTPSRSTRRSRRCRWHGLASSGQTRRSSIHAAARSPWGTPRRLRHAAARHDG